MADREDVLAALRAYHACLEAGTAREDELDDMFDRAEAMVPHARFSDLYFWGERERSDEEAVDEALHREIVWQSGGELAVLLHVQASCKDALEDPSVENHMFAEQMLSQVSEEIRELQGKSH